MGSYSTVINNAAIPAETGYILVNQELTSETDTYELVITFNSSAVNQQEEEVKQTVNLNVSVDSEQDAQLAPGYNI